MKIKYVGSMPRGYVEDRTTGKKYNFKRGVPIEVSDELGAKLVAQKIWTKSSEEKTKEKGEKPK